jgi:5-methylcytosine-specific restriction endonuclease McrA
MARLGDRTCCVCGKAMWGGGKSGLPQGEAMCRGCRRVANPREGEHGTRLMYRERGCRCPECRAYIAAYMREYTVTVRERDGCTPTQKARPRRNPARSCPVCGELVGGNAAADVPTHNDCRPEQYWTNAIQISRRDRLAIYERDNWQCQLCYEPVDPSLDIQHRFAATLDHVVPRSMTLFPDDSPQNLRLTHRSCNSARGNRVA